MYWNTEVHTNFSKQRQQKQTQKQKPKKSQTILTSFLQQHFCLCANHVPVNQRYDCCTTQVALTGSFPPVSEEPALPQHINHLLGCIYRSCSLIFGGFLADPRDSQSPVGGVRRQMMSCAMVRLKHRGAAWKNSKGFLIYTALWKHAVSIQLSAHLRSGKRQQAVRSLLWYFLYSL